MSLQRKHTFAETCYKCCKKVGKAVCEWHALKHGKIPYMPLSLYMHTYVQAAHKRKICRPTVVVSSHATKQAALLN